MNQNLLAVATKNIKDIINFSIKHDPNKQALVIYDRQNGLTDILTEAYRAALPKAQFVDFDATQKDAVIDICNSMNPGDLVVLIQSSNFRLDQFRIRLHLFQRKLKVIEHMHLYRNSEDVWDVYINALEYDPSWYQTIGAKLQKILTSTKTLTIQGGDAILTINGGLEPAKLNIGDYSGMENIGGTFPIGEVFTEGRDFSQMNGSFMVYAYAGEEFTIEMHQPFRVEVTNGMISGWSEQAPSTFGPMVETVKSYERPLIREIGFGLNRAITKERYPQDITAFERILGLHFSLGEKHTVYKKPDIVTTKTKFHIDLFPVVDRVSADGIVIFENGAYKI